MSGYRNKKGLTGPQVDALLSRSSTAVQPGLAPRITKESERHELVVNDALASGGWGDIRSAGEERADHYEGRRYVSSDLATLMFDIPTELGLVGLGARCPFVQVVDDHDTGRTWSIRAIPTSPRVILHNSAVALPIFEPVHTNAYGFLVFRYIGEKPIHTVLKGSIQFAARHSNTLSHLRNRYALALDSFNTPQLEKGQANGRRWLSHAPGYLKAPSRFLTNQGFSDYCLPVDSTVLDRSRWGETERWTNGSQHGYISRGSSSEMLELEDNGEVVPPEVQTTNWFDVSGWAGYHYIFDYEGQSSRSRVQFKRANGSIYYDSQSGNIPARRVYRIPKDAVEMRIYYSGYGDSVTNPTIRALLGNDGYDKDPISGWWTDDTWAVHRDVVFWPGAEYALRIFTTVVSDGSSRTSARAYGFRFYGGGLSFEFDARDIRNKLGGRAYVG